MLCTNCQKQYSGGVTFCPSCGAPLTPLPKVPHAIIIGRGRDVDYFIDNQRVSQRHAALIPKENGHFLLQDLGSRNGVFLGSLKNRIQSALVTSGDTIFLGDQKMLVSDLLNGNTSLTNHNYRRFLIGRSSESDIRLEHSDVSRSHAVLEQMPDGSWKLEDLNSQNGTFVGSRKIAQIFIRDSDFIRFGTYEIQAAELIASARQIRKQKLKKSSPHQASPIFRFAHELKKTSYIKHIAISLALITLLFFGISALSLRQNSAPSQSAQAESNPAPSIPVQPDRPLRPGYDQQALVEKATVLVVTKSGFGSGFFIAPDMVLTNRHVVERKNTVCLVANKAMRTPVEAVVTATSMDNDYAVLRLKTTFDIRPLTFSTQARRSDRVAAWGYPGLLVELDTNDIPEVVYSSGEINVVYDSPPLIAQTANISQGNSGGPLVNERGQVVGVNTLIYKDDPRESYRQVSLAFKADDIISFLRKNNLPHTVAE